MKFYDEIRLNILIVIFLIARFSSQSMASYVLHSIWICILYSLLFRFQDYYQFQLYITFWLYSTYLPIQFYRTKCDSLNLSPLIGCDIFPCQIRWTLRKKTFHYSIKTAVYFRIQSIDFPLPGSIGTYFLFFAIRRMFFI